MHDEDHVALDPDRLEPGVEVALVIGEAITAVRCRTRIAHADIVRRQAAAEGQQMRDDVSPQVGRRGVAVQEHDRIARAGVDIGHLRAKHGQVFPIGNVFGGDWVHGNNLIA